MLDKTYSFFADKYGDMHIATPISVASIQNLAKKSQHILEIGGGVGTLTYTALLVNPGVEIETYEDNLFCIKEFNKNLEMFKHRYVLHTDLRSLPMRRQYDLIIVDGGANIGDCGYPGMTQDIFQRVDTKFIYFEGVRRGQRKIIRKLLQKKKMWVSIVRIPFQFYNGSFYKGGTLMICKKSTSRFRSWRKYWLNEIHEAQFLEPIFGRIKNPL